jgi:hypothetical protein
MMSRLLLGAIICGTALTGCAAGRTDQGAGGAADSIYVEIINENYYDARVHAGFGTRQRRPLGTVPGQGGRVDAALEWQPEGLVLEVTLIIDGRTFLSVPRDVVRDERLTVRLPANIESSAFFYRLRSP